MQYAFFVLLFLYITNWRQVHNWFHKETSGTNTLATKATDKKISDFIFKTTKVHIDHVYIAPSKAFFAFCGGVTKKPILVISKGAYEAFSGDALDWLVLHEIGHHVLDHSFGIITVQLSYAIIGGFLLSLIGTKDIWYLLLGIPLLSTLLAIAAIQTNKIFEIYANTYAVKKIKNPNGMKEGAMLMMKQLQENGIKKDTLLMQLFYTWNYSLWHRTIAATAKEMQLRENHFPSQ